MYRSLLILGLSFSLLAHAGVPELDARKFVLKKHFNGKEKTLSVAQDKTIPFRAAKLFRVRPSRGEGGWTVLVSEDGGVEEIDKTSLKSFLKSLKKGLTQVTLAEDKGAALKISHGLLNHLSTARRTVVCTDEKAFKKCELTFLEGDLQGQSAVLQFDSKSGAIYQD